MRIESERQHNPTGESTTELLHLSQRTATANAGAEFGCARVVFDDALRLRQEEYQTNGKTLSGRDAIEWWALRN